ncbi:TrkH family potassium uptake protein [Anoxybacillus sp. ST4]|uniref:TrkH family potassium uptake protein n=1 Tax=Anoxybacillus sp. ST4 TaxID=2864181 RepID=UPI001C644CF9|nr:TrkH family potassium uptake protein [Anoxybacillus sp. ST4]
MKSRKLSRLSTVQLIVLFYFTAVCISTFLLWLPIFHQPGVELHFVDALFTAVSAISVTGLTVVSTADTFNTPGVFVLAFILQFGGIGIMALGTFIWLMFGKKIGFRERQLIMTDQNQSTFSGLVKLMKEILTLIIAIEMVGAVILGIYFLRYFPSWQDAFFQGFFASVSATTNAGFDITGQSLIPFADDYVVQAIHMILLVLGAIGFPVLIEVKEFLFYRQKRQYRFSLFTKLTTVTFFLLVLFGTCSILLIESHRFFANKAWHESLFYALFQSISSRNGGLATMDVAEFSEPTLLILSALMFIGASPSSVGGGIRTTTFAIIVLTIFFYAKGKDSIKVFQREIHHEDILKSFIVFGTASILCFLAVVLLSFSEPFTMIEIVFEVCSAFGTTGLSMGITSQLSTFGKLVITVLMFIGRIGILSFLFLIRGNNQKETYHYPKERIIIG